MYDEGRCKRRETERSDRFRANLILAADSGCDGPQPDLSAHLFFLPRGVFCCTRFTCTEPSCLVLSVKKEKTRGFVPRRAKPPAPSAAALAAPALSISPPSARTFWPCTSTDISTRAPFLP